MSTRTSDEIVDRRRNYISRPKNLAFDLGTRCIMRAHQLGVGPQKAIWPSPKYANDPKGFANDILGVELWSKQSDILEAIRDNARTAVSGGRKVGKDFALAIAALWWYASFDDARVVMTATRAEQVDKVLWRDVKKLWRSHGLCVACKKIDPNMPRPCPHSSMLDGDIAEKARTGLKADDGREIMGTTAKEAEKAAGVSGTRLLYLIDEASGIEDSIHHSIRGNLASEECREVLISNPTRNEGFFYRAFHETEKQYAKIYINSEDGPNVVAGKQVFPGLASRAWIEAQREEWGGPDGALYMIHVKGQFVEAEEGKLMSVHLITESTKRWEETPSQGLLHIGLDPAGPSGQGDESAFAVRRGQKIIRLHARRGLDEEAHVSEINGLIREHGKLGEIPIVTIDGEGSVGAKVYTALLMYAHSKPEHEQPYQLIRLRTSDPARREPQNYVRVRDEVWANMALWLRSGGAIPEDGKLQRELHVPELHPQINGKAKVTPKEDMKKILKRSPDRADACCLAVWEVRSIDTNIESQLATREDMIHEREDDRIPDIDPYGSIDAFRR